MIYLDTSCLLKLLREEPESADVRRAVDAEDQEGYEVRCPGRD